MKQIIETDVDKCQGCAGCMRICPVKEANISYIDKGKTKVRIDPNICIACGVCLEACPHDARWYNDDTERFFDDLGNGERMTLVVAPAFTTNFRNWRSILAWLKTKGISRIVDVSLGVDICTWAHIRYIEKHHSTALITQPCPPIVGYIEKHCPELLKNVSPARSPILCTSTYLKKTLKLPEKIAALTPCPAKANEFEEANIVGYNVTFKKLADYLTAQKVSIPQADFDFDNIAGVPGRACTIPSNLADSVRRIIGCLSLSGSKIKVEIIKSQGNVYRYLDLISREEPGNSPVLLDALNCVGGCSFGAGCNDEKPKLQQMTLERHKDATECDSEQLTLFSFFDHQLKLFDYIKSSPSSFATR